MFKVVGELPEAVTMVTEKGNTVLLMGAIQNEENYDAYKIYESVGCDECHNIGYRGRKGIFELMVVNEDYEDLILSGASEIQLFKKARSAGMTTLQEDGILKVLDGLTSLQEVESVTGPLKW